MAKPYTTLALILLNTVVVFGALNLVCWLVDRATAKPRWERVIRLHGMTSILPAYPRLDAAQVIELHRETWDRPLEYEPLTEFREPASKGKYVNVSPTGFRMHEGGAGLATQRRLDCVRVRRLHHLRLRRS